jgi:hypothetical protein
MSAAHNMASTLLPPTINTMYWCHKDEVHRRRIACYTFLLLLYTGIIYLGCKGVASDEDSLFPFQCKKQAALMDTMGTRPGTDTIQASFV